MVWTPCVALRAAGLSTNFMVNSYNLRLPRLETPGLVFKRRHVIGKVIEEVDCCRSRVDMLVWSDMQEAVNRITVLVSSNMQKTVY